MTTNGKTIRSRAWCFTWNNYRQHDIDTLLTYFSSVDGLKYVFQQEQCPETSTPHLQGVMRFPNAVCMNFQDNISKKIHWERCRNWNKSKAYCSKVDSRVGNVFTNVENLKIRQPLINHFDISIATDWQSDILQLIETNPDDRTINWYWEDEGKVGKSRLTRHILLKYKNSALAVLGSNRDILYGITTFVKNEKNDLKILIIDVPRSSYHNISYKAMEQVKNGFFFNSKYESEMVIFNPPHIIVFSNFPPDYPELSVDRWNVVKINQESSVAGASLRLGRAEA